MKRKLVIPLAVLAFAIGMGAGWWFWSGRSTPITRVQPLPPPAYVPPKTADPALLALVNRNLKINERIALDMPSRFPTVAYPEDIPVLAAVLADSRDEDTVRNEVASLLARSNYPGLAGDLTKVVDSTDEGPRFRAFATQHLGGLLERKDLVHQDKIKSRLHEALNDKSVEVRREALLALTRQQDQKAIETAVKWLNEPGKDADAVRDLAINCALDLNRRDQIPAIRKYVRDQNEAVRIAAIVTLSQWGDEESRTAFEEAARSNVVRLQRAGKAALERLDKAKAGAVVKAEGQK